MKLSYYLLFCFLFLKLIKNLFLIYKQKFINKKMP